MPQVSFVIPCYNKEPYISYAMRSCLDQTLKDIEVVVVDDKSTDCSLEVIEYWARKDDRVKILALPKNVGRSQARNAGNKAAISPIICVMDADDASAPKRAAIVADHFRRKNDTGLFYGSFEICDFYFNPVGLEKAQAFDYERTKKTGLAFIGHSSMAYPRELALKMPYEADEYADSGLDDWKLQLDWYHAGVKFDFTTQVLYKYRQLSNSISQIRDAMEVRKLKEKYFELHGELKTAIQSGLYPDR